MQVERAGLAVRRLEGDLALRHVALAEELEELANRHGGRLLGTGVNPGFLMDALPAFVTSVMASGSAPLATIWRASSSLPSIRFSADFIRLSRMSISRARASIS